MSLCDSRQMTEHYDKPLSEQSQQLLTQEKGFDYTVLTPQVRILVQAKTSELKSLIRRNAHYIIDIGQKLTEVKRPALKIEAEITQNRSSIIFIVPCERSSWSLLQKSQMHGTSRLELGSINDLRTSKELKGTVGSRKFQNLAKS